MVITRFHPITVHRNGSQAAYLSVPARGITIRSISTVMSITIMTIGMAIMVLIPLAANIPCRHAESFMDRQCTIFMAMRLRTAATKLGLQQQTSFPGRLHPVASMRRLVGSRCFLFFHSLVFLFLLLLLPLGFISGFYPHSKRAAMGSVPVGTRWR